MPTVSIVIPSYGPSEFLRSSIETVLAQTFTDWELIVVDDGSPNDISWINREFPAVKLIEQFHMGVSVARNRGVLESTGEFVSFLDHDDLWKPEKLANQVEALQTHKGAALTFCELELIDEHGKSINDANYVKPTPGLELLSFKSGDLSALHQSVKFFSKKFIVPSSVMFRRSALPVSGLLDPFLPFSGDFDFIIKMAAHYPIVRIGSADVLYRRHSQNLSLKYEICETEVRQLIHKYENHARLVGDLKLEKAARSLFTIERRTIAAQAFDRTRLSLREKQPKNFVRHLCKAISADPAFVARSISKWVAMRAQSRCRPL